MAAERVDEPADGRPTLEPFDRFREDDWAIASPRGPIKSARRHTNTALPLNTFFITIRSLEKAPPAQAVASLERERAYIPAGNISSTLNISHLGRKIKPIITCAAL